MSTSGQASWQIVSQHPQSATRTLSSGQTLTSRMLSTGLCVAE